MSSIKTIDVRNLRPFPLYNTYCDAPKLTHRHNGNILLLSSGHLVHIDFGFMLSNSPGSVGFELAPFKLSQEYLSILGGSASPKFEEFRSLLKKGFMALRKNYDKIVTLVEMLERGVQYRIKKTSTSLCTHSFRLSRLLYLRFDSHTPSSRFITSMLYRFQH